MAIKICVVIIAIQIAIKILCVVIIEIKILFAAKRGKSTLGKPLASRTNRCVATDDCLRAKIRWNKIQGCDHLPTQDFNLISNKTLHVPIWKPLKLSYKKKRWPDFNGIRQKLPKGTATAKAQTKNALLHFGRVQDCKGGNWQLTSWFSSTITSYLLHCRLTSRLSPERPRFKSPQWNLFISKFFCSNRDRFIARQTFLICFYSCSKRLDILDVFAISF